MKSTSRFPLALSCAALLMALALLLLPILSFQLTLYTKRSANTFVGDEKYQAARQEVEDAAEDFRHQGMTVQIDEQVTERTNSKGVKTSMVAFSVTAKENRSGLQLLTSGLTSGRMLLAVLLLGLFSLLFAFAGIRTQSGKRLLSVSTACALIALLLTPLIPMALNLQLSRKVSLYLGGNAVHGIEALLPKLDAFLYGGNAGAQLDALLGALSYAIHPTWLCLLPLFFAQLFAALRLRDGQALRPLLRILLYVAVIAFSIFILYPFFVMLITAFRSNTETTDMYFLHILPSRWVFSNLKDTLDRGVLRYLVNSLLIAGGATGIAMLCGIPAAYAMARMDFKGRTPYLGFVIMSQMFSPVVLLVGISRLMNMLHLNDTLLGLMLINAAFNQAFAIWLLRGTFVSISPEMEQAACIDGCSTFGALTRILLPMAAPGIVTTLIFIFINAWNEYTISTVLISSQQNRPITVGITQFSSFNMIEWQYLFAAALLATVPVVILFMCIEKHLAAGLTAGGVKG